MTKKTEKEAHTVFPVGVLVRGRRCLVVGGGNVALRKISALVEAGADVAVVSPDLVEPLRQLVEDGVVSYASRSFTPEDVQNNLLVFAATNNAEVNRAVLESCREAGCFACSVDKSWIEGDFVTPASFRNGDLTVSVSTGGKSCRRSKLVKDSLARHVEMVDTASLLVMGTSHNYLPIEQREPFHLSERKLQHVGSMLMQVWGVHEFALLNTCNRIELIAVVTESPVVEAALKRILRFDEIGDDGYYRKRDHEAFAHMGILTAGLLSQTPGENHIVAQVKDAVGMAMKQGWASGMLQQWLSSALHIAKDIRKRTATLLHHQEIEDLALQYMASETPDWPTARVLVIGAGMIGRSLVESVADDRRAVTWCYHNREPDLPPNMKKRITLCDMNAVRETVGAVDVVVCATASEGHVLHMGHAPFFDQERLTLVVDLAMPRNVAPGLNSIGDSIRVADLDDLKHWYRREKADMPRILDISRTVIDEHQDMFDKLIKSFQGRNREGLQVQTGFAGNSDRRDRGAPPGGQARGRGA